MHVFMGRAAKLLEVHPNTVRNLIMRGELIPRKNEIGYYEFCLDELLEVKRKRERERSRNSQKGGTIGSDHPTHE